jgi:hypothetical protein
MPSVTIWLSREEDEKLVSLADREKCSKSVLARRILVDYLKKYAREVSKTKENKSNIIFKNEELEIRVIPFKKNRKKEKLGSSSMTYQRVIGSRS